MSTERCHRLLVAGWLTVECSEITDQYQVYIQYFWIAQQQSGSEYKGLSWSGSRIVEVGTVMA